MWTLGFCSTHHWKTKDGPVRGLSRQRPNLQTVGIKKEQAKGINNIFNRTIGEKFPKLRERDDHLGSRDTKNTKWSKTRKNSMFHYS